MVLKLAAEIAQRSFLSLVTWSLGRRALLVFLETCLRILASDDLRLCYALTAILEIIVRSLAIYHRLAANCTCSAAQVNKGKLHLFLIGVAFRIIAVDSYDHLSEYLYETS